MSDTQAIAAQCIADPAFARSVLDGSDHTEVREAIIADAIDGAEVSGFFNPQPDLPGCIGDLMKFDRVGEMWNSLTLTHLTALAQPQT
jgi:hypothetical protein